MIPKYWFGDLGDTELLCLASSGSQQAPILAAAGAVVTSFDQSSKQLGKDAKVAARNDLFIRCLQGDTAD